MRPATASRLARLAPMALASVLLLGACVTTAAPGWTFEPPPPTASPAASGGSAAPSGSAAPASGGASASAAAPSGPAPSGAAGATIELTAANTAYDKAQLQAPAGVPFHIAFTNNDAGVPHNVQITAADGSQPFKGALVTGVATMTYDVPALPAGTYTFSCVVHPSMTGTLTVQ